MDIKLFSDFMNALEKAINLFGKALQFPAGQREKYRQVINDTYRILNTALDMVTIRLSNLLKRDDMFLARDVGGLKWEWEWLQAERDLQLCENLRSTRQEARVLGNHLVAVNCIDKWNDVLKHMDILLHGEKDLAEYIAGELSQLADAADRMPPSQLKEQLRAALDGLDQERYRLMEQQLKFHKII